MEGRWRSMRKHLTHREPASEYAQTPSRSNRNSFAATFVESTRRLSSYCRSKTTSPKPSTTRPSELERPSTLSLSEPPVLTVDLDSPPLFDSIFHSNHAESTHLSSPRDDLDAANLKPTPHSRGADPVVETTDSSTSPSSTTILPSVVGIAPSPILMSHKKTASTSSASSNTTSGYGSSSISNSRRFSTSTSTTISSRGRLSTTAASFLELGIPAIKRRSAYPASSSKSTISVRSQVPSLEENISNDNLGVKLYQASAGGHVDDAQRCILDGADPSYKTQYQWTPLHCAAHNDHFDIVQLLVSNGAELSPLSDTNVTPLDQSLVAGHSNISRCLRQAGGIRCSDSGLSAPILRKRTSAKDLRSNVNEYRSRAVPQLIEMYDAQSSLPYKVDRGAVASSDESGSAVSTASAELHKRNTQSFGALESSLAAKENAKSSPVLVPRAVAISETAPQAKLRRKRSTSNDFGFMGQEVNVNRYTPFSSERESSPFEWSPLYTAQLTRPCLGSSLQTIHENLSPEVQPRGHGQENSLFDFPAVAKQGKPCLRSATRTYRDMPYVAGRALLSYTNSYGTSFAGNTANAEDVNTCAQQVNSEAESIRTPEQSTGQVQNVFQSRSPFISHKIEDFTAHRDADGEFGDGNDDCHSMPHPSRANSDSSPSEQREALSDTDIQDIIRDELPQHQGHLAEDIFVALRTKSVPGFHESGQFVPISEILKWHIISADACCDDEHESSCNDQDESQGENYDTPSEESNNGDNGGDSHHTPNDVDRSSVNKSGKAAKDDDIGGSDDNPAKEGGDGGDGDMLRCPVISCHRRFTRFHHLLGHLKADHGTSVRCDNCKIVLYKDNYSTAHPKECPGKGTKRQDETTGFSCTVCREHFWTQIKRDLHIQSKPRCDEDPKKRYSVFRILFFDDSIFEAIDKKFNDLRLSEISIMNDISSENDRRKQQGNSIQSVGSNDMAQAEIWQAWAWVVENAERNTESFRNLAKWYWTRKILYPHLQVPSSPYAGTLDNGDDDDFNLIKEVAREIQKKREGDEPFEYLSTHRDVLFERDCRYFHTASRILEKILKKARKRSEKTQQLTTPDSTQSGSSSPSASPPHVQPFSKATQQLTTPDSTQSGSSSPSASPPHVQPLSKVTHAADDPELRPSDQAKRQKQTHEQRYNSASAISPTSPSTSSFQTFESNQQDHQTQQNTTTTPEITPEVSRDVQFPSPSGPDLLQDSYAGSDHEIYGYNQGQAMTATSTPHASSYHQSKYATTHSRQVVKPNHPIPQQSPYSSSLPLKHQYGNPSLGVPGPQNTHFPSETENRTNHQVSDCTFPATIEQSNHHPIYQQSRSRQQVYRQPAELPRTHHKPPAPTLEPPSRQQLCQPSPSSQQMHQQFTERSLPNHNSMPTIEPPFHRQIYQPSPPSQQRYQRIPEWSLPGHNPPTTTIEPLFSQQFPEWSQDNVNNNYGDQFGYAI